MGVDVNLGRLGTYALYFTLYCPREDFYRIVTFWYFCIVCTWFNLVYCVVCKRKELLFAFSFLSKDVMSFL